MTIDGKGAVWDLTSYFPTFAGPEMNHFKAKLAADIALLQERASALDPLHTANADAWESILVAAEDCGVRLGHLSSYIENLASADSKNESYSAEQGRLSQLDAELSKFRTDLLRGLREAEDELFASLCEREPLRPVRYHLWRNREEARRRMRPSEEKLASELGVDGMAAWGRLYGKVSGKLEFDMAWPDGRQERLPISRWRSLMEDPDRAIGRAAFEGGNQAWASIEDVCAAALNAISGTRLTLYKRRGVEHFLDEALFQSAMSRETLEAMYTAVNENVELPRAILKAKAAKLGRQAVAWYERDAMLPLPGESLLDWEQAVRIIDRTFGRAYPDLASYYRSMLKNRWIESESRAGKRPGGYCTGSKLTREQRIYMTFNGTLGDAGTLAHEVGHAWHSHLMKDLRPWACRYPMTLAETASTFAEHVFGEGVQKDPDIGANDKLRMLDSDCSSAATFLLDITTRFEFEKAMYEERAEGELSVARLKALMSATQRKVMGDALLADGDDPLFWASKLHFYITGVSFYNYPYTFGYLLSRSFYARFREEGASFLPQYEAFLRNSGSDTVENVVRRSLGADITEPSFWATAIQSLGALLDRYQAA